MKSVSRLPLYWRVCLINGLVFVVGTAVFAVSPATVSARVLVSEAVVLTIGLTVIVVVNSLLLRTSLAPLDRLARFAPGLPGLIPETELVIYRVAQEALTNAARHAGADTVDLSLSKQGDRLALRVADNGRGLHGREEGAGIRGMRERALLVGGDLRIGPRTGGGTEVRLLVPTRVTP